MNIIFLTQTLPYPLDSGGNIYNNAIIPTLLKLNHNIILFSFVDSEKKLKFEKYLEIMGCRIGKTIVNPLISPKKSTLEEINKIFNLLMNLFSQKPFSVSKFYNKSMSKYIIDTIKKENIDCIWIDKLSMTQYLPSNLKALKVLFLADIDSQIYNKVFLYNNSLIWKLFAINEWIKYKFYEKKIFSKFRN